MRTLGNALLAAAVVAGAVLLPRRAAPAPRRAARVFDSVWAAQVDGLEARAASLDARDVDGFETELAGLKRRLARLERAYTDLAPAPPELPAEDPASETWDDLYRYWALTLALRNGDVDYARRELPSYIEDYDGIDAFKGFVANARKRLAELDEGGSRAR